MEPSLTVPHVNNKETAPYPQGTEPLTIAREVKTLVAAIILNRLRFKDSQDPDDTDLERHETNISVGDHTALVTYLLDYFSVQEGVSKDINFLAAFDIALAHDLGDTTNSTSLVGIKKDKETEEKELEKVASLLNSFPEHFRTPLREAYSAYLARESREAQLVRGLNGLATMLYVLWKPKEARYAFVGGNGYTQKDYAERIGTYCAYSPELSKMYKLLERFFVQEKYFREATEEPRPTGLTPHEKVVYFNQQMVVEVLNEENHSIEKNLEALLSLYSLKHTRRFEKPARELADHHDTVPEHVALLLFLGRYFYPLEREQNPELDLRVISRMILLHDASEGLTGDKRTFEKTEADIKAEETAAQTLAHSYLPHNSGYHQEALKTIERYEGGKSGIPNGEGNVDINATFVKMLDVFEAELQIFNPVRRKKLVKVHPLPLEILNKKLTPHIKLFPAITEYFDTLLRLSVEQGVLKESPHTSI